MATLSSADDILQNQNDKWAVLIGVDFYLPHPNNSGGPGAGNLGGCVADIKMISQHLIKHLGLKSTNILELTASKVGHGRQDEPREPWAKWPTYKNMIRELKNLTNRAKRGDFVYIHYSGHGGQARTLVPKMKGDDGIDETLIPTDFNHEGRHLRDFEIGVLLKRMVDKGLHVTAVFDSCHSSGANRGPKAGMITVRGIGMDSRPPERPDLSDREIDSVLSHNMGWASEFREGFWLEPQSYTVIAACRPDETAKEMYFGDGLGRHGVLTYWLIKSLQGVRSSHSWRDISKSSGEHSRFGRAPNAYSYGKPQTPLFRRQTFLNEAGRAQGVCENDLFAVFPWNASGPEDLSSFSGKVRVTEVSEMYSKARFESLSNNEIAANCCQALFSGTHARTYIRRGHSAAVSTGQTKMLDGVEQPIQQNYSDGISPLGLATDESHDTVYSIAVDEPGHYGLLDRSSHPIPNMPSFNEPKLLLDVAAQLGRFQQFRNLENNQFPHKFTFELLEVEHRESTEVAKIPEGKQYRVRFTNESDVPLFLIVLHFTSLWGISHVFPRYSDFEMIYPQNGCDVECESKIPKELSCAKFADDVLKTFIATKPSSFRSLTMPGIDARLTEGNSAHPGYVRESTEQRLLRNLATYGIPGYAMKIGDVGGTRDS
ncbi:caspase domain-containing protein [Xylaria digitata]|nr:caspase domain-containing protein [Xylaria digitata]